jgi:arsenate reductase
MIKLYGIPNCDTVKKARSWLDANDVQYSFHDFKKTGASRELIQHWLADVPWDVLVNRKGTTWRTLPDERKEAIVDTDSAAELMLESSSVIKRPVLSIGNATYVGFSDQAYQQIFKK